MTMWIHGLEQAPAWGRVFIEETVADTPGYRVFEDSAALVRWENEKG